MSWLALEIEIEAAAVEPLSDALLELGADSVIIEAAASLSKGAPLEDAALPCWERNRLRAIVSRQTDPAAFIRNAAHAAGLPAAPPFAIHPVGVEDWVRRTQSQFGPLQVGERLWIVPSWSSPPANQEALVLRLDPGLAFGTGSHPTTRLVLVWLERQLERLRAIRPPGSCSVLDYGCGSGVLAFAAAKLGAAEVFATDNDPQALATCTENARKNDLRIFVMPPGELQGRHFDFIVANILAGALIELAPTLGAHAKPGAGLALCGILEQQAGEVIAAYAPAFELAVAEASEGWALIAGVRR